MCTAPRLKSDDCEKAMVDLNDALHGLGRSKKQQINSLKTKQSESTFLPNDPGFPKEYCFLKGSDASPVYPCGKTNMQMKMSMENG
jgi:hypothetical protein